MAGTVLWKNMTQVEENGTDIGESCCFTNTSILNASAIVYCCSSTLSIFGAGSIIFYSLWKKIVNSPEVQPLFHLAVANLLLAVMSVIGVILFAFREHHRVDCFYFNCVEEAFFVISFFLTVNYGINVYIRLKERTFRLHNLLFTTVSTSDFYNWTFRVLYLGCWLIPVAMIIPLVVKFKGLDTEAKIKTLFCSRCLFLFDHPKFPSTINSIDTSWAIYNSLMMIISLAFSILLLLILYYMTERIYTKALKHSGYHTNTQRTSMANMRKRIFLFILIFIICWFPAFVIACKDLHKIFGKHSTICDQPYYIQALTAPLQGFLNSIIYGWTRKTFRTAADRQRLIDESSMQVQTYGSSGEM